MSKLPDLIKYVIQWIGNEINDVNVLSTIQEESEPTPKKEVWKFADIFKKEKKEFEWGKELVL